MNRRAEAFRLFDNGKASTSLELKALRLKNTTRYNHYSERHKSRGLGSPSPGVAGEAKGKAKARTPLPRGEYVGCISEVPIDKLKTNEGELMKEWVQKVTRK